MLKGNGKSIFIFLFALLLLIILTLVSCGGEKLPQEETGKTKPKLNPSELEFAEKFSGFIESALENIPSGFSAQSIFNFIQLQGGGMGGIGSAPRIKKEEEHRKFFESGVTCSEGGEMRAEAYFEENGKVISEFRANNCKEKDIVCGGETVISGGITSYTSFCKGVVEDINLPEDISSSDYSICLDGRIKGGLNLLYMKEGITSTIMKWFAEKLTFVFLIPGFYTQEMKILMFFTKGDSFLFSTPEYHIGIFPEKITTYMDYKIKSFTYTKDKTTGGVVRVATEIESAIYIRGKISLSFGTEKSGECVYAEGIEVETEEPISIYIKSEGYGKDVGKFKINSGKVRIGKYLSVEVKGDTLRIYVDGELKKELRISAQRCLEGEAFLCE